MQTSVNGADGAFRSYPSSSPSLSWNDSLDPGYDRRGTLYSSPTASGIQPMWKCPKCPSKADDSFEVCAVVREIREESSFEVRATKLLALLDRNRHGHLPHVNHIYKVFIRCEILGGSPTTSHEIQG